ncbi:uncharacterized protein IWZ02DRAFT_255669 [Phyllosticta citriasiana]|uniref:uncharacterized protein n=1 Tax=Phyllosticta citriasiana TaxID=595635 RepID=UPI0030FD2C8A
MDIVGFPKVRLSFTLVDASDVVNSKAPQGPSPSNDIPKLSVVNELGKRNGLIGPLLFAHNSTRSNNTSCLGLDCLLHLSTPKESDFRIAVISSKSPLRIPPSLCPQRQLWRSTLVVDSGFQLINVGGLQGYCPERSDAGTDSSRKSLGRRWKRVTARILSFCNILDGLSEQSSKFESNPPGLRLQSAQSREARAQSWGMRPFQRKRPSRSARPTRASRHEHVLLALNEQKRSAA